MTPVLVGLTFGVLVGTTGPRASRSIEELQIASAALTTAISSHRFSASRPGDLVLASGPRVLSMMRAPVDRAGRVC